MSKKLKKVLKKIEKYFQEQYVIILERVYLQKNSESTLKNVCTSKTIKRVDFKKILIPLRKFYFKIYFKNIK